MSGPTVVVPPPLESVRGSEKVASSGVLELVSAARVFVVTSPVDPGPPVLRPLRPLFPVALLLLVLGGILLMVNTDWFKVGAMHGKLTLALLAIGLLHASRGVMKKMIAALEQGDNAEALAKKYGRMRAVVLLLLVLITAMILGVKASLSMPNTFQLIGA